MIDCYKLAKTIIESNVIYGDWTVHEGDVWGDEPNKPIREYSVEEITDIVAKFLFRSGCLAAIVGLIKANTNDEHGSPIFESLREYEED